MYKSILTSLFLLAQLSQAAPRQLEHQIAILRAGEPELTSSNIRDVLKSNKIISQVLDDFEPSYSIEVTYPDHHHQVLLGNNIDVAHVQQRPIFTFRNLETIMRPASTDAVYSLILTDPDATSYEKPVKSEMCHWIMSNLTTSILDLGVVPEELVEYMPPGPPKKTGPHRYVFVLLEGKGEKVIAPRRRAHWGYKKERHGVRDWAKDNNLKAVGANFFYAQNKKQ